MTKPPPIYDLVLLLDIELEDPERAKIVADARAAIEAQGELLRHDPWGERALAYPIERKASAEYHLLQFHAGSPQLLQTLDHSLRIIDGILRFRIIKLEPGVPEAPDMRAQASSPPPPRRSESEQHEHREQPPPQPEAEAAGAEQAPEPAAEQPAEQAAAEAQVGDPA
jgi:small subunit ribosomal protein S6